VDALASLRDAYRSHGDAFFIAWDGHNSRLANQRSRSCWRKSLAAK
jgi:hypothetical protein